MKKTWRSSRVFASVMVIAVIILVPTLHGCFKALRSMFGEEPGIKYDHARHAVYTPQCISCHKIEEGETTRAKHKDCLQCHPINESEQSPKCFLCHTGEVGRLDPVRPVPRPSYALAFPRHEAHLKAGMTCSQCHGEVEKDRRLSSIDFMRMEDCVRCHFPNKLVQDLKTECSYCHLSMNSDEKPAIHQNPLWYDALHGKSSLQESFLCMRCHRQHHCDQCHRVAPPKDHSSVFKQRAHGLIAVSRNTRCMVCHTQDFCVRCHTTVQPKYHTSTFKDNYPYTHCGMCHEPLDEGNRCRVCHFVLKHAEAKAKATPVPPFVDLNQPCFSGSCHLTSPIPGVSGTGHPVNLVRVRHLYNTIPDTQCIECHR
jgi:hypothetical protein